MRGIIEGFYGPPWSWDDRRAVAAALSAAGMDTYVYAPKDDPLHRERWREPYPDAELEHFGTFAADGTLELSIGISPGLTIDPDRHADRADLLVKCDQLVGAGATVIGLLLDDLPPEPGLGARHGHLAAWLRDALPAEVELFVVPTQYTGTATSPYLTDLDRLLPAEVPVVWTGPTVVCDRITATDAEAWSAAVGGRSPLLWDNVPVNDAVMADHLFPGPLRGRDPDLPDHLAGYLANPMVQARASMPALLSAAAWLRGEDPQAAWDAAVGAARVLAEGCDAARVASLADDVFGAGGPHGRAADELLAWLVEAERCDDGGWGEEVRPWVEALRAEAAVARSALEILRSDPVTARRSVPILMLTWPPVRSHVAQVLGGRGGVRPVMGQDDELQWVAEPGAFVPPANVCDRLVAAAFASLT
jgi:hypothetical protein